MTTTITNIIQKYQQILKNHNVPIEHIILFGSHAKGKARKWSDIDLCIVSRTFGKDRFDEMVMLKHLTDDETMDIEPHPFHPRDLADKYDPLAAEIRKYGIQVV